MEAIQKVDWDTVDYQKSIGDYITMPNGEQRYIEMQVIHWYWLKCMLEQGQTIAKIMSHIDAVIAEEPELERTDELLDDMFRSGILAYGREWIRVTQGR